MSFFERFKQLLAGRAEKAAGEVFVVAKQFIVEFGCAHVEDGIKLARTAWDAVAKNTDFPWIPEPFESQIEAALGDRIELGIRQFAEKFCAADGMARGDEFAGDALTALVEDTTLPPLA